jgi:hypothetical protein
VLVVLAQPAQDLKPVPARQSEIEDEQVKLAAQGQVECNPGRAPW